MLLTLNPIQAFAESPKRYVLFASSFVHEKTDQGVTYDLVRSWIIDKKGLRAFECSANYNYSDQRKPPAGYCNLYNMTLAAPLDGSNLDIDIETQFGGTVEDEQKYWPGWRVFKRPGMFWFLNGDTGETSFCDLGPSFGLRTCERMMFGSNGGSAFTPPDTVHR